MSTPLTTDPFQLTTSWVAVNGKQTLQRTVQAFVGSMECLTGAKNYGIACGTGSWNIGDINSGNAMKQVYDLLQWLPHADSPPASTP